MGSLFAICARPCHLLLALVARLQHLAFVSEIRWFSANPWENLWRRQYNNYKYFFLIFKSGLLWVWDFLIK